jgi:hypothetical protein
MIKLTLITDDWRGAISKTSTVENAEWAEIEPAVLRLNQAQYTQVLLRRGDGAELLLGGGRGQYQLSIGEGDDAFANLVDDARRMMPKTKLVTGGQVGLFPAHYVVGLDAVLAAIRGFIEEGRAVPTLAWERSGALVT